MGKFEWKGNEQLEAALSRAEQKFPGICQAMLRNASQFVLFEIQMASDKFAKYWKVKAPKHNAYGWFSQIQLKGKTSSGAPASVAATVYEFGRGGEHPQTARPFIGPTIKNIEEDVQIIMQNTYDQYMSEVMYV